jgi:hydrogenase maturation protease
VSPRARVIALGQAAAGDDGVGFAVLDEIRQRGVPAGVELISAPDSTVLFTLLETTSKVVLVDAVLDATAGRVLELALDEVSEELQAVSSHGIGVGQLIGLARFLSPERISPSVCIVGVTIGRPDRYHLRLSPVVAAAVARAADRVLALVAG